MFQKTVKLRILNIDKIRQFSYVNTSKLYKKNYNTY